MRVFYESRNFKGITACNSEYKYQTLHNRLLQDKEMTVRRDCDQSERVPAEHYSLTNTEFVFLFVFIIILIFNRNFNYIHYIQCLTNLLKQIYVRFFHKLCKVCAKAALN